ncbi:branched-chain amino acid ABC transporter permease [Meridianimarinicoccus roseus]|uniref:Branched-chain amino acid ABC transporter permease n=2 Tax=Meridianimarinicoccus roseus TaxID=2072018 RepID=A0A2V2LGR1_9RHOB|nr:branched-chain amino acid ABC transporter permease [Meridianimarinicoccus roseus]
MLAGLLAMTVQAMPGEGETLAALLADPGLWPLRAPAALEAVLASWVTLTLAGLAMGMMVFLMASGLTLIFGLMDVINFGHGAFVSLGAFVGVSVLAALAGWMAAPSLPLNLAAVGAAVLAAMAVTGAAGYAFERVIVRPVYGAHLKQILVTVGGLIIAEQLIYVIWGPAEIYISRPEMLKGAMVFGGVALETYRLLAVAVGLAVFAVMGAVLRLTRIGLIVRAGVQDGEMVEALGYRLRRVFIGVFVTGSALAGLGGVLWALYQEVVTAHMGADLMVLVFVVVIIGGLGSVTGCFLGALMIGLVQNYTAFVEPKLALVSTIAVLVLVLMWRPTGMLARDRGRQS